MARKTSKTAKVAKKTAAKRGAAKATKPRKAVAKSPDRLGDEFLDAVDRFVAEAELFARWATAGTDEAALAARNGLLRLTRLYSAGLELPASSGGDETDESVSVEVDRSEWKRVLAHAARLPLDYYGEVFNPLPVPPEEPVVGSVADDIADVYRDVVTGMRHFQAGRRAEALWEWTFSLQSHWGEHATGAIRALHCWLARNDPSGLSAEV
jgi:hypothetical protein